MCQVCTDQDQPLVHRALFDFQQASHRLFVEWIAAEAEYSFRRVGQYAAQVQYSGCIP